MAYTSSLIRTFCLLNRNPIFSSSFRFPLNCSLPPSITNCRFSVLYSSFSSAAETLSGQPLSESRRRNVVEILEERGLLESITNDNLRSSCSNPNSSPIRVYCGFDPTAESLHIGNLIDIILLSWFLRCSHTPVELVGGAIGRVGDPSGKSIERPELDPKTLERNIVGIRGIIRRILGKDVVVLNNYDWWKDVKLLNFLKDVGKFARVGTMMAKESVRRRLESSEQGLSYTEFTYQLLQEILKKCDTHILHAYN